MNKLEDQVHILERMPEGELKEAMKGTIKFIQKIDKLQARYDAMPKEERESLPKYLREFFCDKAA